MKLLFSPFLLAYLLLLLCINADLIRKSPTDDQHSNLQDTQTNHETSMEMNTEATMEMTTESQMANLMKNKQKYYYANPSVIYAKNSYDGKLNFKTITDQLDQIEKEKAEAAASFIF